MASITQQAAEEFLQKLHAEMSPEDEQYMMQLLAENTPAAGLSVRLFRTFWMNQFLNELRIGYRNHFFQEKINQSRLQGRKRK